MHKNNWNSIGIVRLKEIQPHLICVMTGPKRCHELLREKIGRRPIISDRGCVVSRQRPNFPLHFCRRLLRRTSQSKSSFASSKTERGRYGCSDPFEWSEIFAWTYGSHSDQ